jgi:DNA helicase IV
VARRGQAERWIEGSPYASLTGGDDARLVVLTGLDTKGLEFDGIVVVEPQEIEDESPTGRATLYVVLTRATQRLVALSQS